MQFDLNLNQPLTVTELTRRIKETLESGFADVWVTGEITGLRIPSSGHIYFSLKDNGAQVRVVFFRAGSRFLKFRPEDGLEVILRGRVTLYEPRGEYQIIADYMEPKGLGALQLAFLQMKEKLDKEGLFDPARKRPLPLHPKRVGVVTSPTGAAIRDILNVLGRRAPGVQVLIAPASVQGADAPREVAQGIADLNRAGGLDCIIVARGGGSIEDLAAFNTEVVARAIAASRIPTISAIGHEVDFTIADFVADLRAPTPSAAAELVAKNEEELKEKLDALKGRMALSMANSLRHIRGRLASEIRALADPKKRVQENLLRVDDYLVRVISCQRRLLKKDTDRVNSLFRVLMSLEPLAPLSRGFAIARKLPELLIVKDAAQVEVGDAITLQLNRGEIICRVEKK